MPHTDKPLSGAGPGERVPDGSMATPLSDQAASLGGDSPESQATVSLAGRTAHGLAWFLGNMVLGKGLAFVSFAVLGIALQKDDFGVYATAFALAAFAQVFRDGGVTYLLPQRGEKDFQRIAGSVFWMAGSFNLCVGILLAVAAVPAAAYYADPRIASVLWVLAIGVPLGTPATVFTATMQMRLQFHSIARIGVVSSVVRNTAMIAMAMMGAGPLSFAVPIVLGAVLEGILGYATVRDSLWRRPAAFGLWPELFRASRWLILTVIAAAGFNQGAYLVLGLFADSRTVGVFFFAYQLVLQIDALLNFAVGFVLFGAFSAIKDDVTRRGLAAVRAARAVSLIATPATVALAVVAEPFEQLVWGGKWAEAVFAIQAVALTCVWRIVYAVPGAAISSSGLWRLQAALALAGGVGVMVAMAIGSAIRPDPDSAALALSAFSVTGLAGLYIYGMVRIGVSARRALGAVLRVWLIGIVAAGLTFGLEHLAQPWLASLNQAAGSAGSRLAAFAAQWLSLDPAAAAAAQARTAIAFSAAAELLLLGVVFTKAFLVGLRLGAPGAVRDALSLSPARLRPHLERLFIIRAG